MKRSRAAPRARAPLTFGIAVEAHAAAIAAVLNAAADHLTHLHGHGHWSGWSGERGVRLGIAPPVAGTRRSVTSRVVIARARNGRIIGTLRLATKKPWAIDVSYFTPVERALYLTGMAVHPNHQRRGVGRRLLDEAIRVAQDWPGEPPPRAIRLDAYDTDHLRNPGRGAGAGGFYAACGWREVARVVYKGNPLTYFEMLL